MTYQYDNTFVQAFTRATLALYRHDPTAKFLAFKRYSLHPEDDYLFVALVELHPRKWVVWNYNDSDERECGFFCVGEYFAADHHDGDDALADARQHFNEREVTRHNRVEVRSEAYAKRHVALAPVPDEPVPDEPEADDPFPEMPASAWSRAERKGRPKIHFKTSGPYHAVDIYLPADSKGWQLYDHGDAAQTAADRLGIALARTIYAYAHDLADAERCREFMTAQLDRYSKFGAADSEGFITAAEYAEGALGTTLGLR